jgi:hypothetical protein
LGFSSTTSADATAGERPAAYAAASHSSAGKLRVRGADPGGFSLAHCIETKETNVGACASRYSRWTVSSGTSCRHSTWLGSPYPAAVSLHPLVGRKAQKNSVRNVVLPQPGPEQVTHSRVDRSGVAERNARRAGVPHVPISTAASPRSMSSRRHWAGSGRASD